MIILALLAIAAILGYIYRHEIAKIIQQFEPMETKLKREWDSINKNMEEIRQIGGKANLEDTPVEVLEKALMDWVTNYKRLVEISQITGWQVDQNYTNAANALKDVFKE